jgi:hypothetical protein
MENNKNLFNEIKELEEKKNQISKSINELNEFSTKLQDKLNEENIHIEDKVHQYNIAKDKLKNDAEIKILEQENEKLEQFLQLLAKQYELELKYIEQYCDHKSKIEKMSEKYSHINFNDILSLKNLFNKQFSESKNNSNNAPVIFNDIDDNNKPPRPPPPVEPTIKRRNTISTIVKNPEINNSTNDIRQNGSLQDHLKHALSTKYKALRPDSPDNNFD